MDAGRALLDLAVVIAAARLAAEVAERLRQPAVVAEIAAGVLIGPSVLGVVHPNEVLRFLGEIGVILLLFEVGRQMDLRELGRVGGAALRVAVIGVALPMAGGYGAARALGLDGPVALFLAGSLTATSVGITARVFGDLRALATAEARTVLGAAVADDVLGLVILTVVTRAATGGGVDPGELAGVLGLAVGFVAAATLIGSWLSPRLIDGLSARARTDGAVMAIGLVLALAFARLASAARLAPIVGAFVAGLAVGRSQAADDLHRRLVPVGHFFVPIFFLQIGMDADVSVFGNATVLRMAAVLTAVAVVGKIVAGLGTGRGADRLLIGIGMIPRGEVGLIFASLGLSGGVLDQNTYGALVAVVLVTTLVAPPWLRRRIERARGAAAGEAEAREAPAGGWLSIDEREAELRADPPAALAPRLGLEAAAACATRRPGPRLVAWLAEAGDGPIEWDDDLRAAFLRVAREGNRRSWRFLDASGLLRRLMPELDAALRRRPRDPFDLDPAEHLRLEVLEALTLLVEEDAEAARAWERVERKDLVLLGAVFRSAFGARRDAADAARRTAASIGLPAADAAAVAFLVEERHVLQAAAARLDMGTEESVLELAAHIGSRERTNGLFLLAVAENALEPWERERLEEMARLLAEALVHPELTGPSAADLVAHRRNDVLAALPDLPLAAASGLLKAAPRHYVLAHDPETIARHVRMMESRLARGEVRVRAEPAAPGEWAVHVVTQDRPGLLAGIAGALSARGLPVTSADVATWSNGIAVDTFRVQAPPTADWDEVEDAIEAGLRRPTGGERPIVDGAVEIDNHASPWHSIVEVRAEDRAGLLARVAGALSRAGLQIRRADVTTRDGVAVDTFWVTGRHGGKLEPAEERALRASFAGRAQRRWGAPWRRMAARVEARTIS